MNDDRTIPRKTITEMVQRIEPTWNVHGATPAVDGHHIVYHLDVEMETGCRQCVLKATPAEKSPTCDTEARLLAILNAQTSLPVPDVLGVVDEEAHLPTPFFIASVLPGENYPRTGLAELSETAITQVARSTGRQLASLHRFDAVDAYGFVGIDADEPLTGGQPSADVEQIIVDTPRHSWADYLTSERDRLMTDLETTRFGDLRSTVRPVLEARIDELSGEFDPVIARIDQSLDNVLLDPETNTVAGLLDWEFCIAATPAYDLAFVEQSLSGGHWKLLPDVPDHSEAIRSALLDGYREVGPSSIGKQFHDNRECYALLAILHTALNFDAWFEQVDAFEVTTEQRERAADRLRKRIERFC